MTKFQLPRFYAIGNSLLLTSLVLMSFMFDAFYVEIQAQNINPCGTPALTDIERDFLLNTVYNQPLAIRFDGVATVSGAHLPAPKS